MKRSTKSLIFKLGLTFLILCVIMLFIVDVGSPEMYVLIASVLIDLAVCVGAYISIRIGDKKDK